MNTYEIGDKAHVMNPLTYKEAQVILESYDEEVLHETVHTVINVLAYNASWDFKIENQKEDMLIRSVISFRYNGTITAANSLSKIEIPKEINIKSRWK